ncbi:MAG: fibronectin type III domain-containing protein [Verrucomicrobia bacterium]|nr:fibronectin type III domain-containing protein [Verrucomicrobiota bacterium]
MLLRVFPLLIGCFLSTVQLSVAESEFFETLPNGERPPVISGETSWETNFVGAARQPSGNLANRLIFTCGGHGWTWSSKKGWYTQRGVGQEMNEDYGNLDQMNSFVPYAFNSGATVVTFRPVGQQTNEVVLDNDSRGVTFSGKWFNSSSEIFFGKEGALPYRFAPLAAAETATATYTPKIPLAGFYPVYTWARHGADRTSQLYRILHTGGQTLVRVPHHMVGNGWVYLGTYYFDAGANRWKGSVVISNLQPSPGFGSVAIADAVRFGNGMGDFVPEGGTVSGYPREEEASRYWVESSFGQGQTNFLARGSSEHQGGNVGAPIRLAREMNRESEGNMFKRIYLGFHSNAGGGRGVIGLWNNPELFPGTKTPNQERWAELLGIEVNDTFTAMSTPPLEVPWFGRTRLIYARDDYAFGELNDRYIGGEFDATILEVAFHDSADDAKLLRDPKVRDILGRCSYQATVRYMNEFDDVPMEYLSQPPQNPRARSSGDAVVVAWDRPVDVKQNTPESYLVYRSENGYGFGKPVRVPATKSSVRLEGLPKNKAVYFRVTALNAAGESLPSTVVGARRPSRATETKVLFVNGFTQFDRFNNPRQTIASTNYIAPGAFGKMDRVIPRLNNAFDYVVQHGNALDKKRRAFDSCQRDAISSGLINLDHYSAVIWASGRQQTNLFDASEQRALSRYVAAGGNLFLSGAHIAEGLAQLRSPEPSALEEIFGCDDCPSLQIQSFSASAEQDTIFRRNRNITFGEGRHDTYFLATVNAFNTPNTAVTALLYGDAAGTAAVQFETPAGGKVVCFGFPFETISSEKSRAEYLSDILDYFELKSRPNAITPRLAETEAGSHLIWFAQPGRRYQLQASEKGTSAVWKNIGAPVSATGLTARYTETLPGERVTYRVIRLN